MLSMIAMLLVLSVDVSGCIIMLTLLAGYILLVLLRNCNNWATGWVAYCSQQRQSERFSLLDVHNWALYKPKSD